MSERTSSLFVAIEIDGDGEHPAAWRLAHHTPSELITPVRVARLVQQAERAGFNAVTLDDSLLAPQHRPGVTARLDAVTRAAFAAPQTGTVGLIPVANVPLGEPFHVSGQFSTVDHASGGRAGLLAVPRASAAEAAAYDLPPVDDRPALAGAASDAVRAIRLLWDSWEDGAVIEDAVSGRFLDRSRLHYVEFEADRSDPAYTVNATSITPRPPQGQVPVFAAPDALDADLIDVAIIEGTSLDQLEREAERVRALGIPRVIARLSIALDHAGVPAEIRTERLDALGVGDGYPASADEESGFVYRGDAAGLTQLLTVLSQTVDGVLLIPQLLDEDLEEVAERVLPALRTAGIHRPPHIGQTLRDQLALARPTSVFAESATEADHEIQADDEDQAEPTSQQGEFLGARA